MNEDDHDPRAPWERFFFDMWPAFTVAVILLGLCFWAGLTLMRILIDQY